MELITSPATPARPDVLPIASALLVGLTTRPYGVEERVDVSREGERLVVRCRPGEKPAGLLLDPGPRRLPDEAEIAASWWVDGEPGFSGGVARRGGSEAQELHALHPAHRTMTPAPEDRTLREAPVFVLDCPKQAATLTVTDLRLIAQPAREPAPPRRSAWAWSPQLWRDQQNDLIARAQQLALDRLFVAVEISDGRLRYEVDLASFVARARAAGIATVVVEGDPHMALADGRRTALERLAALTAYQRRVSPESRLQGVQYDIEPYLLAAYRSDPAAIRQGWAATIEALHGQADGLPVDVVLPFWLPNDEEAVRTVLPSVARSASRITVMAYRTSAREIQAAAEPLLAWGTRTGKPVHIALEAGPVDDEVTRVYAPARTGPLQVIRQGDGRALALLLDEPHGPATHTLQAYALADERATPAGRISFMGDEERLHREARTAVEALKAWSSFAGLAFHGLF